MIERLHALWSGGDLGSIPEIYAPDFVAHMPKGWGRSEPRNGHDGIEQSCLNDDPAFDKQLDGRPPG